MRSLIFALLPLISVLPFVGCNTTKGGSKPSQLIDQLVSFKCVPAPDRLATAKQKYAKNVRGGEPNWRAWVFNHIALLPHEYQTYVFDSYNVPITGYASGGNTVLSVGLGLPRDENGNRPGKPDSIQIANPTAQYFGLLHETGHASQPHVDDSALTFNDSLVLWFNEATKKDSYEFQHMWDYPKSDITEYFAELFDSYYCSQQSRDYMAKTYPRSFQFAARYLINPNDLDGGSSLDTAAYKMESDPNGDEDDDGVKNSEDQCSMTAAKATIHQEDKYRGCTQGQELDYINRSMASHVQKMRFGASLGHVENLQNVSYVHRKTAAEKAGIRVGDKILKINGIDITSSDKFTAAIKASPKAAKIQLKRVGASEPEDIVVQLD